MKIKKVLLLCKESAYNRYILKSRTFLKFTDKNSKEVQRIKKTHIEHFKTLQVVEKELKEHNIQFTKLPRGGKIRTSHYDLIISVGGDGTFLEAARNIKDEYILGVNSDPHWSVGQFCIANRETFPLVLKKIINNQFKIQILQRMQLKFKFQAIKINVLNDILVCHKNPAGMSRYYLTFSGEKEEQRSSGIWVATAAGSTGAIHSAGGRILPLTSAKIQFKVRELYCAPKTKSQLDGGMLTSFQSLKIFSLMNEGVIYVDGCHLKYPFPFGEEVRLTSSSQPLRVIKV